MVLAIDIGNTSITLGCISESNNDIIFEERVYTDRKKSSVEFAITLKTIFELHDVDPATIDGGIISSSVPPITANVKNAVERLLKKKVIEVGPGIKTGVDIKIDDPAQLGPDLLVGAVAGIEEYGAPLILIDLGTASTISVINDQKRFMGGVIMPGIHVSLDGLCAKAAHLPAIALDAPKKLIGSATVDSMQSGIIYGHASCIDGMIERIWEELGYKTAVVATGGLAGKVIPNCKKSIEIDDQLLIKGLMSIYHKNAKQFYSK